VFNLYLAPIFLQVLCYQPTVTAAGSFLAHSKQPPSKTSRGIFSICRDRMRSRKRSSVA
jgi:hypothetical protein